MNFKCFIGVFTSWMPLSVPSARATSSRPTLARLTASLAIILLCVITVRAQVTLTTLVHFDGTNG